MTSVTTIAALAAVLLGLVTAVLGLVNQRNINAAAAAASTSAEQVDRISLDVDGRLTVYFERQAQLLDALYQAGIPIPAVPAAAPATVGTMTDTNQADLAPHTAALTKFFETTLPAAALKIGELQRQGIKNLRAFEDLLEDLPHAAAAIAIIIRALQTAPTPAPTPAPTSANVAALTSTTGMPGEQTLPGQ